MTSEPTPNLDIRFDDNANLSIFFEGEWVGWETIWSMPEHDKTKRFRAFRKEALRRIVACVTACLGIPTEDLAALRQRRLASLVKEEMGLAELPSAAWVMAEIARLRDQVRTAKAHIRDIILSGSGVDVHNIAALSDALAFLVHDSYHALANAELEKEA